MRKIISTIFVTLDGVTQAPGGPEEDRSNNFDYGGWSVNYWDELMGSTMSGFLSSPFELLLGRCTYDIFAAYWPLQTSEENQTVAKPFNATKKYVVSHSPKELTWNNSELVTGDVAAELKKLKQMDAPDLWVHGSGNLVQTLLKEGLLDRIHIWTFPVMVGPGKRLFEGGTPASGLKLAASKISTTGVIIATYEGASELKTGSF